MLKHNVLWIIRISNKQKKKLIHKIKRNVPILFNTNEPVSSNQGGQNNANII